MDRIPGPFDKKTLLRTLGAGVLLGVLGIGAFIGLWLLLGQAGMADFPRLMTSLCIPPALIAAVVGLYMLLVQPGSNNKE